MILLRIISKVSEIYVHFKTNYCEQVMKKFKFNILQSYESS